MATNMWRLVGGHSIYAVPPNFSPHGGSLGGGGLGGGGISYYSALGPNNKYSGGIILRPYGHFVAGAAVSAARMMPHMRREPLGRQCRPAVSCRMAASDAATLYFLIMQTEPSVHVCMLEK